MQFTVSKSEYISSFRKALRLFPDFPAAFFHTDLLRIGAVDRVGTKDEICQGHLDCLQEIFEGRPLLFPTFNYDFYRTRVYDVLNDPCKIGVLNEYVRRRYPDRRNLTPVFSQVVVNDHDFDMGFFANPFGKGSLYDQGVQKGCIMVMLGAGMQVSTFQHYIEVAFDVPYRYRKPFQGEIRAPGGTFEVVFEPPLYPLDPRVRAMIRYDFDRNQRMATEAGYATTFPLGRGEVLIYSLSGLLEVISVIGRQSLLCCLTDDSQKEVGEYLATIGGRMTLENMEPGWTAERKKPEA